MTGDECKRVIGYMMAAWPNHKFDDLSAVVWADNLREIDLEDGLRTAKLLVRSHEFFPTVAQFRETWRIDMLRRSGQRFELDAPRGDRLTPDEVRARIAAMKALLPKLARNPEGPA